MKLGRLIIFDASAFVIAVLKADSVPEQALLRAAEVDFFALSAAVDAEISEVLNCSKFARFVSDARRQRLLDILREEAVRFEPALRVTDCRDVKDNGYLGNPPPFLVGFVCRIHAARFSFWAAVTPPMPILGRSLSYVQS